MSDILTTLGDIEKAVSILGNIFLAIYGVISTIRSKKWKNTSQYLASVISQNKKNSVTAEKFSVDSVLSNAVRFSPEGIKKYVIKAVKGELTK